AVRKHHDQRSPANTIEATTGEKTTVLKNPIPGSLALARTASNRGRSTSAGTTPIMNRKLLRSELTNNSSEKSLLKFSRPLNDPPRMACASVKASTIVFAIGHQ